MWAKWLILCLEKEDVFSVLIPSISRAEIARNTRDVR